MTDTTDDRFTHRMQALIANAINGLDPADREERIAYCRDHGAHGVRMFPDPDGVLELRWGGRTLAMVRAEDLASGEPLRAEFVGEIPSTVPDGWTE